MRQTMPTTTNKLLFKSLDYKHSKYVIGGPGPGKYILTIAISLSLNRQIMNCQLLQNEKKSVIAVLNAFQDPIIKYI